MRTDRLTVQYDGRAGMQYHLGAQGNRVVLGTGVFFLARVTRPKRRARFVY